MTLLPISVKGDGAAIYEAVTRMFCRAAAMSRKRPSPMGLAIPPESVGLIAAFDHFYNGKTSATETAAEIDKLFV